MINSFTFAYKGVESKVHEQGGKLGNCIVHSIAIRVPNDHSKIITAEIARISMTPAHKGSKINYESSLYFVV